jgi:HlyD family secretion protein
MRLTKRRTVLFALIALAIALSAFAFRPRPAVVQTAAASVGPLLTTVDEDAISRVAERYEISSPVAGRHLRVDLNCGDAVATGDPMVTIEPAPLDPRTEAQTRARLDSAEDTARQTAAAVRAARDLVAQAEREQSRFEKLAASQIVARNDLDQARTLAASRRADLTAALARWAAARHDADAVRVALAAAATGDSFVIRAPAAGRVLRIASESESVVAAGTPIVEVGDPTRLELVIDVLSNDAVTVAREQEVVIEGWGGAQPLRGVVDRIEPSAFTKVSALGIEEQRVNVIARVIDPPAQFGDRFQAQARIVVWRGDVLRVPLTALFRDGDQWAVFAVRGGRARLERVEVGHRGRSDIEIGHGLRAGDTVIVHPSDQVRDGVRVSQQRG